MTFESNNNHEVWSQEALLREGARRRLASVFFRDAQRPENSFRTRSDLAFDAVYLCALAAIGVAADEYEHPSPEVLKNATAFLGLTTELIRPAITYAECRYEPAATDAQCQGAYDELMALARRLLNAK